MCGMVYNFKKFGVFVILSAGLLIFGCSGGGPKMQTPGKGGCLYGGTFTISETEECQTLYPISVSDAVSAFVTNQIYEGLVRFSMHDLTVRPSIAERWEIDESGTVYTFHLKKGVFFHDDPCFPQGKGREVNANDIKYSLELLCSKSKDNVNFFG